MKTDTQIKKDIQEELEWDPAIDPTGVGILVKDGVVTLTGHLSSYSEKLAAEQAAQRVSGVRALAVEMDVHLENESVRTDTDIAAAANHALLWNALVPRGKVMIKVEDGWVSLNGMVDWDYQRRSAEHAVQSLVGVVGVANLIKISPHISQVDIQKGIEGALGRHAEREARHLQVIVDGSRVTLRGKVQSLAERQAVLGVAWSAPGVTGVINELILG
jgi:osmotically-inducible protein OsmY